MIARPQNKDRKFFIAVIVIASAITILPYLIGVGLSPKGYQFQGNTVLAPGDPNVYYSYIEQARQGAFFMRDVFTSERHSATLWQPVWLILGWLGNFFHLSTPAVYAGGRVLSMILFLFTVRWVVQTIWADTAIRRAALLTVLGASGLGWLFVKLTNLQTGDLLSLPPDIWVSEMTPIISSWATPHFLIVTSGMLFVLASLEVLVQKNTWRRWWLIGLVGLLTLSIHPYHLLTWITFWVVRTIWLWIENKKFPKEYVWRWVSVIVVTSPAIFFYIVGFVTDPIVIERARQNINLTPDWWMVGVGLGALPVFSVFGWRILRHERNAQKTWLATWAIVHLLIIFFPFSGQRRLMHALILPFALLATPSIFSLWRRLAKTWFQKFAMLGVFTLVFSGTILFTGNWVINDYKIERQGRNNWEYFLTPEYQSLFNYLKNHTQPNQPIIASLWDSNLIAGFTARTIVSGHPVETLFFEEKQSKIKHFYQNARPEEQVQILHEMRACYILDGQRERAYGNAFRPEQIPGLKRVWSGRTMALYKTTDCGSVK